MKLKNTDDWIIWYAIGVLGPATAVAIVGIFL
jgi:hypothetical protein